MIKKILKTNESCPSEWSVELTSGEMLYAKYRWGFLSIKKSNKITNNINEAIEGQEIYNKRISENNFDGFLSCDDFKKHLKKISYLNDTMINLKLAEYEL